MNTETTRDACAEELLRVPESRTDLARQSVLPELQGGSESKTRCFQRVPEWAVLGSNQ